MTNRLKFHAVPANREALIKALKTRVNGGQQEDSEAKVLLTTTWDENLPDSDTEHASPADGARPAVGDGAAAGEGP